jgi:hypothetical protein
MKTALKIALAGSSLNLAKVTHRFPRKWKSCSTGLAGRRFCPAAPALAAVLVVSLPASAMAQQVIRLERPVQGIEALSARIDGHAGLYVVDSGLGTSAVTPATARVIGCTPWGKVTGFRATGERVDAERCNSATLDFGPLSRRMPQLSVFDLQKFMGPAGARFAGAIGLDALEGRVITLSVAGHTLTIENNASTQRIAAEGHEVPIRLVRSAEGAALTADLGVATRLGTLWMEIDTGNYGPSLIDKRAAALVGLDPLNTVAQPLASMMVGKSHIRGSAVVRDLILDGDLGREALIDWDVTLDLACGRGWLTPTHHQ